MLKVLFIGLGSIGSRHLVNLSEVLKMKSINFSVDALRSTNSDLAEDTLLLISNIYNTKDELPNDYDIAFITNPTHLHYDTLMDIVDSADNIFIEKPIFVDSTQLLSEISFKKEGIYYVACPMRYTRVIQHLRNEVLPSVNVHAIRVLCSSYLPDWRKGDYSKCYSAMKEKGGGVSLDLIHEWDYVRYLFGSPLQIYNLKGKYSKLAITSDDISVYIAEYKDKLLSMHLDYIGPCPRREIELFVEKELIIADLINMQIRYSKAGTVIDLKEDRDDYQKRELEAFLNMIENKAENSNDVKFAVETLKLVEAAENKESV